MIFKVVSDHYNNWKEDLASPECFYIEEKLQQELDISVFHDDQHGTSVVVAAGLNIIKTLHYLGVSKIYASNKFDVVNSSTKNKNDNYINDLLDKQIITDNNFLSVQEIFKNSNVFIGVSAANIVSQEDILLMKEKPIVFAMANPNPEISYEEIEKVEYGIYGTGISDLPNQINNSLIFPGIFKGLLNSKVKVIDLDLKVKIVYNLANLIKDEQLAKTNIIPDIFDARLVEIIANTIINN